MQEKWELLLINGLDAYTFSSFFISQPVKRFIRIHYLWIKFHAFSLNAKTTTFAERF